MYTEEEAKKKWCPFGRAGSSGAPFSFNLWYSDKEKIYKPETLCIASECMAFRWLVFQEHDKVLPGILTDEWGRAAKDVNGEPVPVGYCGLAGRP